MIASFKMSVVYLNSLAAGLSCQHSRLSLREESGTFAEPKATIYLLIDQPSPEEIGDREGQ